MAGNVNFVPMSSYDLEGQEIARRRRMAEMLQAQSMAPIEQQSVGGMVAPFSMTHGLAKLLQGYSARKGQEAADEAQRALGEKYQGARTADMQLLAKALEGRPATPETMSEDAAGNAMPIPAQAAMPGGRLDPSVLGRLQTPEISNAAMQMWAQQLKKASPLDMIGKIDLSKTTPESQARFLQTGNPADLVYLQKHESFERAGPNGPERIFYDPTKPPTGPQPVATKVEVLPSGLAINPFTTKPGTVHQNPNQILNLDPNNPNGPPMINAPLIAAKGQIAAAGAPKVNLAVNTNKTLFGGAADKVGDSIAAGADQARASVSTISTVNNIRDAINTGKIIAGPGTSFRQAIGQISQVLGTSNANSTEQLTQTRKAIQGLAQLELDAAQQMKGQGQITEAERNIIRRAASGDIDSISVPELKMLMDSMDKTARFKIKQNRQNVELLRQNPQSGDLHRFMSVDEPPPYQPPQLPGQGQPTYPPQSTVVPPPPAGFVVNGGR